MTATFSTEYELPSGNQTLDFSVTAGHGGIGSFEFWGQRCYDRGNLEIEEIVCESELSNEDLEIVKLAIENEEFDNAANEALIQLSDEANSAEYRLEKLNLSRMEKIELEDF